MVKMAELIQSDQVWGWGDDSKLSNRWLPTSEMDSLLSPKVNIHLKNGVSQKRPLSPNSLKGRVTVGNGWIESFAKELNVPVADIYNLYEKINEGSYVTNDGIKANQANFFSSDGINPTAFGQAIIANEVIKTLNAFYGSAIPLISTREYLEK
jgi:lysophospholipase L1-like esterase